ncbi:putative MFS family arabinose efflux permease [Nocardioides daedukensis]|uniref:Putative MFS family arabinose efflux permease n=1 Tax=Nocardioides daedukensis TaxID=634462 RepID=A0A7Y9S1Q8_9ACTN|nr:MFS transporter [Nocardioides daedukensis]NYG58877.1 putative MFS family arabinose efflux permease [Nocardioides daedukensis]
MSEPRTDRHLVPALVYGALSTAIVSSLGMLLVPSIAEGLDVTVSTAQWTLTINLLVGAIATPVMGRISDGPHKKRLLLVSLFLILLGSVLAAIATNFALFLVGRALQGLTYGIVSVTIAMARRYVEPARVQSSISTLSVTVASGIGIGYPLTGVIAGETNFRMAFWFAALFVLSAILVVVRFVPVGPDERAPRHALDFPGATLLGLGLGALLLGISEGENWGWTSIETLATLTLAVVLLVFWVRVELRAPHPLINLRVLRAGDVVLANGTAIGLGMAMYIGLSVGSLVAQSPEDTGYGLGLPVLWAGFVMFPLSVGSLTANRLVRRIAHRIQLATLLPVGAGLMTVASFLLWFAHEQLWEVLLGMLLFGLGMGAAYAAMPALIERNVAVEELGSSVSFNQVLRTVGSSFGTAVTGALLAANMAPDGHSTEAGIDNSFALGALLCTAVLVALLANWVRSSAEKRALHRARRIG